MNNMDYEHKLEYAGQQNMNNMNHGHTQQCVTKSRTTNCNKPNKVKVLSMK